MAKQEEKCIFCQIINNQAPGVKIYEDDDVTCIEDINPASKHHYLILPRVHIANAKALTKDDIDLYNIMLSTIDKVIQQKELNPESTRTGFHWPPFNTVNHLHLHVISPVENMSFHKQMMFKPDSFWFVSTDYVKSRLETCS